MSNRFRIARAIPDLGVKKRGLESLASYVSKHPSWHGFFVHRLAQFDTGLSAWKQRVQGLADLARSEQADLLVLPAAAIVFSQRAELVAWGRKFHGIPDVIAGALDRNGCESVVMYSHGELIEEMPSAPPWAVQLGPFQVTIAVSSGIKRLGDRAPVASALSSPERFAPAGVIDLGHSQYSVRYRKTLEKAQGNMDKRRGCEPWLLLSYWHFLGSTHDKENWMLPKQASWLAEPVRQKISHANGVDWLDLVDVDSDSAPIPRAATWVAADERSAKWPADERLPPNKDLNGLSRYRDFLTNVVHGAEALVARESGSFRLEWIGLQKTTPSGRMACEQFYSLERHDHGLVVRCVPMAGQAGQTEVSITLEHSNDKADKCGRLTILEPAILSIVNQGDHSPAKLHPDGGGWRPLDWKVVVDAPELNSAAFQSDVAEICARFIRAHALIGPTRPLLSIA